MFQRLSSLFFGEVEEVAAELKGENPCVTEADEEGWMLVNLPVEADCTIPLEGERVVQSCPGNVQPNRQDNMQTTLAETEWPRPPLKRRRTHRGRARELETPLGPCAKSRPRVPGASTPGTLSRRAEGSALSASPGSGRECGGGGGGSSSAGSERGCMDESWFVTPPPCFTAEGATAEASPMEDLLIEHPSMSVYVSPNNLSMVSNGNLSVVGEESVSLAGSMSRVADQPAAPAMPTRASRGAAAQAGALAKVTQVARVQRGKARIERRHLGRNRIQRQNRVREQVPRHAAHARNTFLHQPGNRSVCH
ncbi:tumor protein p53-inducible nuclear protein 1 isoform X1 [Gadus macrocephalus]|uniref:tumor protein p53-inducible nuclear protein 1 isoform X1 n=1 Tax=Gadus macrocephalus TaxID=80720 RepID=UPI0028CBB7DC|nr:tumor protein p53-inducible nuclear protein 1 isoform X1 [Gadus macrocephalus]